MKRLFLIAVVFFSYSAFAADGDSVPTLLARTISNQMRDFVETRRQEILQLSANPENIQNIMQFLHMKHMHWKSENISAFNVSQNVQSFYLNEAKKYEGKIVWPEPNSAEGQLLLEYLYIHDILPLAIESRLKQVDQRNKRLLDRGELERSDLRESATKLLKLVKEKQHVEQSWVNAEERNSRAAILADEITSEYERYLYTVSQQPPAEWEKALALIASAFTEIALTAGVVIIAGEDPRNILAWMGLTTTGFIAKAIEAGIAQDAKVMIPFVGPMARSQKWLKGVQSAGRLPSQRTAREDSDSYVGLNAGHWESIDKGYAVDCSSHFRKIAQAFTQKAQYPKLDGKYRPEL
jgi:hypothetical protein